MNYRLKENWRRVDPNGYGFESRDGKWRIAKSFALGKERFTLFERVDGIFKMGRTFKTAEAAKVEVEIINNNRIHLDIAGKLQKGKK